MGVAIKHVRKGREYRLPELPHFSVDGYCAETNKVYEFFGCYFHGCTCQPIRDVITTNGDTLEAGYERTMARLEHITRAGYQVKVQRECLFDDAGTDTAELLAHPIVCKVLCVPGTLCTGVEPRSCVYTIRPRRARLFSM